LLDRKVRCVNVAALLAAAVLRRNPDSIVIPFDKVHTVRVDPRDSILSLAERLANLGRGGTHGSLPLAEANARHRARPLAGCVMASDNESWIGRGRHGSTTMMTEWQAFVKNQAPLHPAEFVGPKLACVDLQPYATTQAPDRADVLNVGGL
jgi:60 kDa SS-A/Ro ribonucleoprotein